MFKYKVSIYMKSGNIIYLKCKNFDFTNPINTFCNTDCYLYKIPIENVEGYLIKKWYQRWG